MTKILTLVALFGVMAIGLVGCGSGDETVTEGDAPNAAGTTNTNTEGAPESRAGDPASKPATMDPPK